MNDIKTLAEESKKNPSNEQRYFDALKRITQYQTVERLRRLSEKDWGLELSEALEMAYDNVREDAKRAIKNRRRPTS